MPEQSDEYYTILYPEDFHKIREDMTKHIYVGQSRLHRTPEKAIRAELDISKDPLNTTILLRSAWLVKVRCDCGISRNFYVVPLEITTMEDYLDGR